MLSSLKKVQFSSSLEGLCNVVKEVYLSKQAPSIDSLNEPASLRLINEHRLLYPAYQALKDQNAATELKERLAKRLKQDQMRMLRLAHEAIKLSRALDTAGIPHCFVKGLPLNDYLYGGIEKRSCVDLDIWVHPAHLNAAWELLIARGYLTFIPNYSLTRFKKRYFMKHFRHVAVKHPVKKMTVELHFKLGYPWLPFFPYTKVRFSKARVCHSEIPTLADDFHLLFVILHGAQHSWTRIRWLLDVLLFIRKDPSLISRVCALAEQLHCESIVRQALYLIQDMFGYQNESLKLCLSKKDPKALRLAYMSKRLIADEHHPEKNVFSSAFLFYRLYSFSLSVKGGKGAFLLHDWVKLDNLFPIVNVPDRLRFLYYLAYPFWALKILVLKKDKLAN